MTNTLTQKTWTNEKVISIETDGLLVKTKSLREDLEYRIKFDELGFDQIRKRIKSANIPFYFLLLFDIMYVVLLVISVMDKEPIVNQLFWVGALVFFVIMTVAAFYNLNTDMIYLSGGTKALELMGTRPSNDQVTDFIDQIHKAMRLHYRNKYTVFDPGTTIEMRAMNLKWLRDIQAISEAEYQELLQSFNRDNIIGFQQFG